MDALLFLQQLLDLPEEIGCAFIVEHGVELDDPVAVGTLVRDEVLRQRDIQPLVSLKLAELLVFFGEYVHHPPSQAMGLHSKGIALSALGHEQPAMDYMDEAGLLFLQIGDEVNWARTRIGWIVSCAGLGRVEEALLVAAQARAVFERYNELSWVCAINHNTAVIYTQAGQYQKALELYDHLLVIYPTLTDESEAFLQRAIALVEMNQGRIFSWLDDFGRARLLLQRASARLIALEQIGLVVRAESSLATLDYVQGYYGSALRRYYHVRDILLQRELDRTEMFARVMSLMAGCLVKLDRVQEACQLGAEAVKVYRELGLSIDGIDVLREYAAVLIAANRLKDAFAALEEAEKLFEQGDFIHYATITRLQQAELLLEMGSLGAAYEQAASLKVYFDQQGLVARSATACLIMAAALINAAKKDEKYKLGKSSHSLLEAMALCEHVVALANQHNLQESGYKSQYLLGQLALLQGDMERAEIHYSNAIEQIEQILDHLMLDLRPAFLHTTWAVYEDMIALCLQQEQAERAFNYLERARSLALRQYLSSWRKVQGELEETDSTLVVTSAKSAIVLRMQSELNLWQDRYHGYSAMLATLDGPVPLEIDREVLKAEIRRCEDKIGELFERLHLAQFEAADDVPIRRDYIGRVDLRPTQDFYLAQLRQQLTPEQLLLAYFLYQGRLVIFAVTQEGLVIHEVPDGVAQLERLLPPLYAHLEPRGWLNPQNPPQLAIRRVLQKLYSLLIAPVVALLPPTPGTIIIVPYGPLHSLPFHALHSGKHFLIEDFQINYLPASNLLTRFKASIPSIPSNSGHREPSIPYDEQGEHVTQVTVSRPPLIFGYSGHGELQRALEEAKALAIMLHGECYLEEQATIVRLTEESTGSPIIHLATHGKSRLDAPNFSYVRLADGQLNAIDAFSLNLEDCELVTLSGCETGLALSGGGDEQLGLGRAFLAAGASSLVMSLWPVEDTSTNELMQLFYQRLLAGDSKVQALRSAQCNLLARSSSSYMHPYFWAAFRLVGDRGPLQTYRVHRV